MKRTVVFNADDSERKVKLTMDINTGKYWLDNESYDMKTYVEALTNAVHTALRTKFDVSEIKLQ